MQILLALALLLPQKDASGTQEVDPFGKVTMPALDAGQLDQWRDYLLPNPSESAFTTIPWLPTFADGIHRAEAEQKPLLLWVMNGHPLGCT
ncbi:MAG: hypothetical protein ACYTEP_00315 [Planctomycetota bacterium]|jgi:hypothetical protein